MAEIITKADLPASIQSHELVDAMVAGANAKASRVAPCLVTAVEADPKTPEQVAALDEARLILVGAVQRWSQAGSGAFTQQTAGPYNVSTDTRQRTGFNLWPSEISDLQAVCADGTVGREAFSIDTAPARPDAVHADICSIFFGSTCSCGADIAGFPLYEVG